MEAAPIHPPRDRRPDALGDLRVLPDEVLCAILELLPTSDLGRLACVSSVFYILCNEEPLWMHKCLSAGGLLEYRGSWKKTTLHGQNLCAKNEEVCQKFLHFDGFNSLFLYRRWYRCFTTLNSFLLDTGDLERRNKLSLDEFCFHYDGKRPVLLTDLAESWPAKTKWTTEQLLANYGDVVFGISQKSPKKIKMKFKDYVSYMELQHDEDPLYIFDDKFGEAAPALLEDYSTPHLFQEDFFDVLNHDDRPPFRWLIIGPERSGASWHVDPGLTSAWNTLLCGWKRWALYPPGRVPAGVTVHVNEEDGDVNIESPTSLQWWLDIYPQLADPDKPIECTQLPGETIFVPSGWWHCVLNLETTIAVTQNFVNQCNFEHVCLDMAPGHRHKGVCRAGLLALPGEDVGDVANQAVEINRMNDPDMIRKEKRLRVLKQGIEPAKNDSSRDIDEPIEVDNSSPQHKFSYDIDFLSWFLEKERDHFSSIWSPTNYIGQREAREWLRKLWMARPELRQLIWKGACLVMNVDKWYACLLEICACHNLYSPSDDERLPIGTGSNPVFIVSRNVIKIYAEGGFESSIHGLGTELEFYNLLREVGSPLTEHIPRIVASGFLVYENGFYETVAWDGKSLPEAISSCYPSKNFFAEDCFSFGIWSKMQLELKESGVALPKKMWPYIVTERCKGDIFAHIRDDLSKDDILHLASYLGAQLRNLHLLPLAHDITNSLISNGDVPEGSETTTLHASAKLLSENFIISPEWELIVAALDEKKRHIRKRLDQWGDPIPGVLIEKVEEYLPNNVAALFDVVKDDDGMYTVCGSPSWVHSDVMDDNILMEPVLPTSLDEDAPLTGLDVNGKEHSYNRGSRSARWIPTHIIDFSDLSVGHPLYDLIPIHLDVFRGDSYLLKKFLDSYGLPLSKEAADRDSLFCGPVESSKFKRKSYRAMCYCILHKDNVLGAIFSLWKELRVTSSWEVVEETVWGELNNYPYSSS